MIQYYLMTDREATTSLEARLKELIDSDPNRNRVPLPGGMRFSDFSGIPKGEATDLERVARGIDRAFDLGYLPVSRTGNS